MMGGAAFHIFFHKMVCGNKPIVGNFVEIVHNSLWKRRRKNEVKFIFLCGKMQKFAGGIAGGERGERRKIPEKKGFLA